MKQRDIVITGAGVVSAIGIGKEETWHSLKNHLTGIAPVSYLQTEHTEFPVGEVKLSDEELKKRLQIPAQTPVVRTSLLGMLALKEALADAGLSREQLKQVALVSGTTVGGMEKSEQFYLDYFKEEILHSPEEKAKTAYIKTHDCGASTQLIADHIGQFAFATSISTACSSAANALLLGARMIRQGDYDCVVVGGAEALSKFHLNGFNSLMILDRELCRPFDSTRAGLNLGEGAAYLVLESEESALRRQAPLLARLSGYGNACDAFHQTASSENGEGAYRAMKQAIDRAGLKPESIDYVNAHGTGTPNNDPSECAAMKRLFGDGLPKFSSTKGFTGHTTSASGSIEAVFCLLALRHQQLPISLHCQLPISEEFTPVTIETEHPETPIKHILCNAFGFGGNDTSLLFSAIDERDEAERMNTDCPAENRVSKDNLSNVKDVYVIAANQISLQEPLSQQWMSSPEMVNEPFRRAADPDFKQYMSPGEARRLGKVLKRALSVSLKTLKEVGIEQPEAIITGTGLGSVESTEAFLSDLCLHGEELLKPTHFMQSTHNTIGSLVAISTRSHGYNSTYSHKDISFSSALYDAMLQLRAGEISNALVGGHDGLTESYYHLWELVDYAGGDMTSPCGEAAMAAMLVSADSPLISDFGETQGKRILCRVGDCKLFNKPSDDILQKEINMIMEQQGLTPDNVAIMIGINGKGVNDIPYESLLEKLSPDFGVLRYKNLFGESFSSEALGFYAAAHILHANSYPQQMLVEGHNVPGDALKAILLVERGREGDSALSLLLKNDA